MSVLSKRSMSRWRPTAPSVSVSISSDSPTPYAVLEIDDTPGAQRLIAEAEKLPGAHTPDGQTGLQIINALIRWGTSTAPRPTRCRSACWRRINAAVSGRAPNSPTR